MPISLSLGCYPKLLLNYVSVVIISTITYLCINIFLFFPSFLPAITCSSTVGTVSISRFAQKPFHALAVVFLIRCHGAKKALLLGRAARRPEESRCLDPGGRSPRARALHGRIRTTKRAYTSDQGVMSRRAGEERSACSNEAVENNAWRCVCL